MYWSADVGGNSICPECGGRLEKENHVYLLAVRRRWKTNSFLVGNDGGHFCLRCSVVVLNEEVFSNSACIGVGGENRGLKFAVLGLVDLEGIPDDKKNLPLGDKESPIPLVEFLKPEKHLAAPSKTASARPPSGNDYCSCGSGKKFKKCCGA